jgi:hypothetical protein
MAQTPRTRGLREICATHRGNAPIAAPPKDGARAPSPRLRGEGRGEGLSQRPDSRKRGGGGGGGGGGGARGGGGGRRGAGGPGRCAVRAATVSDIMMF